jgi:hypothetical protein
MRRILVLPLVALLFAPAAALADSTVTVTLPASPHVLLETNAGVPNIRTDDPRPVFRIQGSEDRSQTGDPADVPQLGCGLDTDPLEPGCGTPVTPCPVDACATLQPQTDVADGFHTVAARLWKGDGEPLADGSLGFTEDRTPPDTQLFQDTSTEDAFRPAVDWSAVDDDYAAHDTARCAFGKATQAPQWQPCPAGPSAGSGVFTAPKLPKRKIDYVFTVQAVDDFGRLDPTPRRIHYDPIPCVAKARHVSMHAFIHKGLPVKVTCTHLAEVEVDLSAISEDGRHRVSVHKALTRRPVIAGADVSGHYRGFTKRRRVKLLPQYVAAFRRYHKAKLVLHAAAGSGFVSPTDWIAVIHVG